MRGTEALSLVGTGVERQPHFQHFWEVQIPRKSFLGLFPSHPCEREGQRKDDRQEFARKKEIKYTDLLQCSSVQRELKRRDSSSLILPSGAGEDGNVQPSVFTSRIPHLCYQPGFVCGF